MSTVFQWYFYFFCTTELKLTWDRRLEIWLILHVKKKYCIEMLVCYIVLQPSSNTSYLCKIIEITAQLPLFLFMMQQQYQSALFWADKVASLSHGKWQILFFLISLPLKELSTLPCTSDPLCFSLQRTPRTFTGWLSVFTWQPSITGQLMHFGLGNWTK